MHHTLDTKPNDYHRRFHDDEDIVEDGNEDEGLETMFCAAQDKEEDVVDRIDDALTVEEKRILVQRLLRTAKETGFSYNSIVLL